MQEAAGQNRVVCVKGAGKGGTSGAGAVSEAGAGEICGCGKGVRMKGQKRVAAAGGGRGRAG